MRPNQKALLFGLLSQLDILLGKEEMYFFKERPFLTDGGKSVIITLSEDDQKKRARVVLERIKVARTISAYLEKLNPPLPTKQENLI